MQLTLKTFTGTLLILSVFSFACNQNKENPCFKNKSDSVAFARSVLKVYPDQENIMAKSGTTNDTIPIPENFEKKKEFIDGFYYKYYKAQNYLISKNPAEERGFGLAKSSGPITLAEANRYIGYYKDWINLSPTGSATEYTKQFSYMIDSAAIGPIIRDADYVGLRIYMGMKVANDKDSQTVILTGYKKTDSSDIYINNMAYDKATPCPWDCPCLQSDASAKPMLGRDAVHDPIAKPVPKLAKPALKP